MPVFLIAAGVFLLLLLVLWLINKLSIGDKKSQGLKDETTRNNYRSDRLKKAARWLKKGFRYIRSHFVHIRSRGYDTQIFALGGAFGWGLYALSNLVLDSFLQESTIETLSTTSVIWSFAFAVFILIENGSKICTIKDFYVGRKDSLKEKSSFLNTTVLFRNMDILVNCIVIVNLVQIFFGKLDMQPTISHFVGYTPIQKMLECPFNNLSFLLAFHYIAKPRCRKQVIHSFLYGRLNTVLILLGSISAVALVIADNSDFDLKEKHLIFMDAFFTFLFVVELGIRLYEEGLGYFLKSGTERFYKRRIDFWNLLDSGIILFSMTSFFMLNDAHSTATGLSAIILFRAVRVLKLLRIVKKYQKDMAHLYDGAVNAMAKSLPVFALFIIFLTLLGFLLSFISSQLDVGKEFFADPITSILSLFRLFTYDGWSKIPTDIAGECRGFGFWWLDGAIRLGFCALVGIGGIVGVALLNSVFVDGMLGRDRSDDERRQKLQELSEKLDLLSTKLDSMENIHRE